MGLEVYLDPCTINSRKVIAGLDMMGVPYKLHTMDYFAGEQKNEDFVRDVNPFATFPAAIDRDLHLSESNSILMYAADLKDGNNSAYPKDLKVRADINRWLLFEASSWFPSCYIYLIQNVVQPLMKSQPDQSILSKEAPNFHKLAKCVNDTLAKHKFIASDEVSIADIALASCMHLPEEAKLPLEKYPNIKRWYADIEKIPAWPKAQGAVDKALCPQKLQNGGQVRATFNYTKDLGVKLTEIYFYVSNLHCTPNIGESPSCLGLLH